MTPRRIRLHFALLVCLAAATPAAAAARQAAPAETPGVPGATAPSSAPAPEVAGEPCPPRGLENVRVSKVRPVPPFEEELPKRSARRARAAGKDRKNLPVVELRDTIAVTVENLRALVAQERCLEKGGAERDIILYLDRQPLLDVVAHPPSDPVKNVLMFPLVRTEDSREVWTYLLGRPKLREREVEVSVGIDDQFAVRSDAAVYLRVVPRRWFSFWLLLFAAFAVGFVVLALRSDVLRDPVSAPAGARPPYSLSRWQAAWWFFLVLAAYLLIGMVTGDFSSSITPTVLALLGISAGTAAGSAFIDASKASVVNEAKDAARAAVLRTELDQLEGETRALTEHVRKSGDAATAAELAAKEALRSEKLSTYHKLINRSESFLLDILSDVNGVNFHRFQILAWTVVLGIIFAAHVYRDLAMPEFDGTLLALMGISAGTYLGLKIPEEPPPLPPPRPALPQSASTVSHPTGPSVT